ncbi:MAG: hypothetical protein J1G02_04105 [Clostridiales bacterium]|nr:hypothetical protein [Clostridiales bacterium]
MKSKKLLVSLAIVAVVVVIIVVLASVFSVRHVDFSYHNFEGRLTTAPDGGIPIEAIESIAKGKSTIFLSKSNFLTEVNAKLKSNPEYAQWHAFAVVKSFPNILEIHFVKRTAIAKLTSSGEVVYLDSFGCRVTGVSEDVQCLDITSAFSNPTDAATEQPKDGTFKFASEENNLRLGYVLQAILATWQCYVEIDQMDEVLLPTNAFKFVDDSMILNLRTGGTIRLLSPETDLAARLQKAYGVYYNSNVNLQGSNWEITVYKNGRIKTPDPNK